MAGCAAVIATVLAGSLYSGQIPMIDISALASSKNMNINEKIYNPTAKTLDIEYDGYLFQPKTLAPGDRTAGLLFYRPESGVIDWSKLRVEATAAGP